MFQRAFYGLTAGVSLGLLIVVALVLTDTRVQSSGVVESASVPSKQAEYRFVEAWKRMRSGTWSVDSKYVRTSASGQNLTGEVHEAQRPPQRVRTAFGTTTIDQPGKTVICAPSSAEVKGGCRTSDGGESFEVANNREVATVQDLVTGVDQAYAVAQVSRHCFELRAVGAKAGTWGKKATFCFDSATGAIQQSTILRGEITDTITATSISDRVKDSEFDPPTI